MQKGDRISHYEVGDLVGRGAFSEVYSGIHLLTRHPVALKVIRLDLISDDDLVGIIRETACISNLLHPNVVTCYQFIIQNPFLILVLEYVKGGTVLDKINEVGCIQENEARVYFCDILSALFYLHHQKCVVHRDVKLQNILITEDRHAKLIDFGFCNSYERKRLNSFVGTPGYTPPEIISSQSYDTKCDIFSLGVCLFAMVTGRYPFDLQNTDKGLLISQIRTLEIPATLSAELRTLLSGMLAADPSRRLSLEEIAASPWVNEFTFNDSTPPQPLKLGLFRTVDSIRSLRRLPVPSPNPDVIDYLKGRSFNIRQLQRELLNGEISTTTAAYFIVLKCMVFRPRDIKPRKALSANTRLYSGKKRLV